MATIEMTCVVPNCDMGEGAPYKTEEVEAAMAWSMLQTHIAIAHNNLTEADTGKEPWHQAERVKSPSLVYSKGNNKWVDRAKDEWANNLHVLIKPMLDQCAQLHEDQTCTPSKSKIKMTQAAGVADTGATVLCSGVNMMRQLGLQEKNLIKTSTIIMAANEEKLDVLGYIPVTVKVVGHPNKLSTQALYITRQLKRLFISRTCLQELGCLPRSWPYPPEDTETCTPIISETLDEWLLDYFKSSTFNTSPHQVLPGRSGQDLKLPIRRGIVYAQLLLFLFHYHSHS